MKIIKPINFIENYNKLDNSIKILVDRQIEILRKTNGKGKHLFKNRLFERKIKNYRLLYLRRYDLEIVLILISITKKKNQQEEIEWIKKTFKNYFF